MARRSMLVVVLFAVLAASGPAPAGVESIRVSCPEEYWYPFLYTEGGQVRGLLHDIVGKAFESLGIKAVMEPVPVRRAIVYAREGRSDAVVTGFRSEWRSFLDYPPETDKEKESPWRIMQADDVVVSFAEDSYEFEGDLATLPSPVRVLRGCPIIEDLNKAGKEIEKVKEDFQNFRKLLRDKKGVIITTTVVAEMMEQDPRFEGKIRIHATPADSNSYHLAFSKKSGLSPEDRERIWKEIVRWRDDYIFMLQVFSQY